MTVEDTRHSDTMAWIEGVVALSPLLQSTTYEFFTKRGQLWVEVQGGHHAAHAWHVAVGGYQLPSVIDHRDGVRRWILLGTRVHVEVIDRPKRGLS